MSVKDLIEKTCEETKLTREELALAIGIGEATVERWEAGIANPTRDKQRLMWLFCRCPRLIHEFVDPPIGLKLKKSKTQALSDKVKIPGSDESDDLPELIRRARTPGQLAAVAQEIAARVMEGELLPRRATAMKQILVEARRAREAEPDVSADREIFTTPQGVELLGFFEGILDGRIRAKLLKTAKAEAAKDLRTWPDEMRQDPDSAKELLAEKGLDEWGEVK